LLQQCSTSSFTNILLDMHTVNRMTQIQQLP
jgi:hypothetical protein